MKRVSLLALIFATLSHSTIAQNEWQTERLVRDVTVVPQKSTGGQYLISWRLLDIDDDYTTFDVLRDNEVLKTDIINSTCCIDSKGNTSSQYRIVTKHYGVATDTTASVVPWKDVFLPIKLDRPSGGAFHDVEYTYSPNDCSVADSDGDGRYEIIVKWEPSAEADNSQGGFTGPTIFDCYKIVENSGTYTAERLWRIDMGHNIRSGAHYVPFLFYDFDGDGKAEFIVKTGPGTTDNNGNFITEVSDDEAIRSTDNTKEYLNGGGQVMYGPEFLTVFNGETGEAIHTVYYNPNRGCFVGGAPEGRYDIWGDDYGNRSERYLATVAHLDANNPSHASAVMCRGYYTRSYLWAVDFDGTKLTTRWRHASLSRKTVMTTYGDGRKDVREYDCAVYPEASIYTAYGQGNHNLTVGDVDNDGCDEIIYGSAAIDHDGTLLWSTGLSHGDAIHMGDLIPDRPGLEVFQIHEDPPFGMHICDAATGELLIHKTGSGDCARGMAADVMSNRGYEYWYFGDGNMYNASDDSNVGSSMSFNFRVYWDGDVYDELIGDIGNHNQPYLEKFNSGRLLIGDKQLYEYGYNVSCNGTKGSPCLVADILGDWREEMIFYNNEDKSTINIFCSSVVSNTRVPCLMYDHNYRMAITWQNSGYNQPPHLGYYLPDATAPRYSFTSGSFTEQEVTLGDSIQPVIFHYNNCNGASINKIIRPTGSTTTTIPTGYSLTKDPVKCNMTFTGKASQSGLWKFIIRSIGSGNGVLRYDTISVRVNEPTGIDDIILEVPANIEEPVYDLQGRRMTMPLSPGIYVSGGRKFLVR